MSRVPEVASYPPHLFSRRLDRRRLLEAGAGLALSAVGGGFRRTRAQEENPPLRILGWGNYFSPEITARFREETGAAIEVTTIGAVDDVVLFLRAGGIGLYDLVSPSSGLVLRMYDEGLIQPFDDGELPNLGEVFTQFRTADWTQADSGRLAAPLLWGSLGAVYPAEAAGSAPAAWTDLFGESFAKKVVMSDDVLGHYWIWNWALGAADPSRVTREQLNTTTDALIDMKHTQARTWDSSVYGAMRRLARGSGMIASVGWQSAPLMSMPGERQLAVSHPAPGDASFCDNLCLVADAPQPDLALAFMNFMIAAETQAALINTTNWATVSEAALPGLRPEVAALVDYDALDDVLARSPIRGYPPFGDDGSDTATYLDWVVAWDRVRAARLGG